MGRISERESLLEMLDIAPIDGYISLKLIAKYSIVIK